MTWKIEEIADSDQPIAKKYFDNIRHMLGSLPPKKKISQLKVYRISNHINQADKLQRQGQYRAARDELRTAYQKLDEMNCRRSSETSTFQKYKEGKRSWHENHLHNTLGSMVKK